MKNKYYYLKKSWIIAPLIPTIVLFVLLAPLALTGFSNLRVRALHNTTPTVLFTIVVLVGILLLFGTLFYVSSLYSTEYIRLTDSDFSYRLRHVHKHKLIIPYSEIAEIAVIENPKDLGIGICNVEKPKYYGSYASDRLGKFVACIRNPKRTFYVKNKQGETYVFSAPKRRDLVKEVQKRMTI